MALTSDQITAQNFKDFYGQIRPYLNGTAHGGFTPIGTIISVMGKTAPHNYLVCDGTVYNIADYPELASYFDGQFNASNYFGGNGTTTFAVPDLRGEFLRGTGTNGHTDQGSGAAVGTHQDATGIPYIGVNTSSTYCVWTASIGQSSTTAHGVQPTNMDKALTGKGTSSTQGYQGAVNSMKTTWTDAGNYSNYAARPTNTSVLYCIATKNIFMDAGSNYSTDEQVVGTWLNGKPLYQKTWVLKPPTTIKVSQVIGNISSDLLSSIQIRDMQTTFNGWASGHVAYNMDRSYIGQESPIWIRTNGEIAAQVPTELQTDQRNDIFLTLKYTKSTD